LATFSTFQLSLLGFGLSPAQEVIESWKARRAAAMIGFASLVLHSSSSQTGSQPYGTFDEIEHLPDEEQQSDPQTLLLLSISSTQMS